MNFRLSLILILVLGLLQASASAQVSRVVPVERIVHGEIPLPPPIRTSPAPKKLTSPIDLAKDYDYPGVRIEGIDEGDKIGKVSCAGDVNGDGFVDFLIGAPGADNRTGEIYLIYGSRSFRGNMGRICFGEDFNSNIFSLSNLELTNNRIVIVKGENAEDKLGRGISGAGDVNSDGCDDILIGAPGANAGKGKIYLIYGSRTGIGAGGILNLGDIEDHGVLIRGESSGDRSGFSVSGAGDVNGDGHADILIGAPGANAGAGETYLIYGKDEVSIPDIKSLGDKGVLIKGKNTGDRSGHSVSGAGDIDSNGYADILIGAPSANASSGETYLIYGSRTGIGAGGRLALGGIEDHGILIKGKNTGDRSGHSVSGAGDVNGDGYADMLIGAYNAKSRVYSEAGETYLIYGSSTEIGSRGELKLYDLPNEDIGVPIKGKNVWNRSGYSVSGAGDVDSDSYSDILIGAVAAHSDGRGWAGETYLIYGEEEFNVSELELLGNEDEGFLIKEGVLIKGGSRGDRSGYSVSGAGDINGDGYADILIGAPAADIDERENAGKTYLIYGLGSDHSDQPTPSEPIYRSRMVSGEGDQEVPLLGREAPLLGVGLIGDGSHSIPFSRCAIGFKGGKSGVGSEGASLQSVTLFRSSVPEPSTEGEYAISAVYWHVKTNRVEFSKSTLRLHYLEREVEGLDKDKMGVYYTPYLPTTNTNWMLLPTPDTHDATQHTFTIERAHGDPDAVGTQFNGYYTILQVDRSYVLGEQVKPPVDPSILSGDEPNVRPSDAALWHRGKLYAVDKGPVTITWKDENRNDIIIDAVFEWSTNDDDYQIHIAGAPVKLPGSYEVYSEVNADVSNGLFNANKSGRSLLTLKTEDTVDFKNVKTIQWSDLHDESEDVVATIGEAITIHEEYQSPGSDKPIVLCDKARYAVDYHNRDTGVGPIIPVNRNGREDDEQLVIVYYQEKDDDGISWPYKPVLYVPEWPEDTEGTIVIASAQGSGPISLDDMEIYRQPDSSLPGYNPNEEHALILPRQGASSRLKLSATEVMVLEGGAAMVEVSLLSQGSPLGDVFVTVGPSRDVDENISVDLVSHDQIIFRVDVESDDPEYWGNSRIIVLSAASDDDSDNGFSVFNLHAMNGLNDKVKLTAKEADTDGLGLLLDILSFDVVENDSRSFSVRLTGSPESPVSIATSHHSGDSDLKVTEGANLTFTTVNWDVPQSVTIEAQVDDDDVNGEAVFTVQATGGLRSGVDLHVREADYTPPGSAIFALRDDLGGPDTSEPYVLLKYRDSDGNPKIKMYRVVAEQEPYFTFNYEITVGMMIEPPYPLNIFLPNCGEKSEIDGESLTFLWKDRKDAFWAMAAGFDSDGNPKDVDAVIRYYYPMKQGFDFPSLDVEYNTGNNDCIPWLDSGTGAPIDVTYTVSWPDYVPELRVGETLMTQKFGLPNITNQCSVDILFQEPGGPSVTLIEPLTIRWVSLDPLPEEIVTEWDGGKQILVSLPPLLRERVRYDPNARMLEFGGFYDTSGSGEPFLLLNVMTEREFNLLKSLSADTDYENAVEALYEKSRNQLSGQTSLGGQPKALTAGFAKTEGYVTLAFQNDDDCGDLPVSVEIIRVTCPLHPGEIKVIKPDCPFDEKLTLRHSGDFAGQADDYEFEWMYQPASGGIQPDLPDTDAENWVPHVVARGLVDITIEGAGLLTLTDNWFSCRYRYVGDDQLACKGWSFWTKPQLAEGWIKRVLDGINPFDQIMDDFHKTEVNKVVSMLSQAGTRWKGDIPLNCSPGSGFGLIEAYETVLKRGIKLSVDAGYEYEPANKALLQAAGRLADLYMLLGNESYADAVDPTIGFGTEDGQYGSAATSIHCFMNQTSSLIQEELELLRGRDDSRAPGVESYPVYNRLYWNKTGDITGGEVAYSLNYELTGQDEEDAKIMYPQGHGDAWGHYLCAIKNYYRLIRHENYTWIPREEAVIVGGVSVTVDFLDERKFAKAAAAKARCGAEIVNLTYRQSYVEDPESQYEGYKDDDPERAWGLSEWASRAGQGAYFDWVVGNAILPSKDSENEGIAKIDRTTVPELREVASVFMDIQAELNKADMGLDPLGLAKNVVPFDISPAEIQAGKTHFEQIYDRAVRAMNNAITVFNYANQQSQLLRRQQDSEADFNRNVEEREADFNNRLIEIFGYPYKEDIGPGGSYDENYDGPDIYHYTYVDQSELIGQTVGSIQEFTVTLTDFVVDDKGGLTEHTRDITFHLSTNGLGLVKPERWTQRRAPGEIQMARSELLQAKGRFERALVEYDNLLTQIEEQAAMLQAQYNLNMDEINVLNVAKQTQTTLNGKIKNSREKQLNFRTRARAAVIIANALAEFLPQSVGFSTDATSGGRGAIRLGGAVLSEYLSYKADRESLAELDHQQAKEDAQAQTNISLTTTRQEFAILQQIAQLEQFVRKEASLRLELYMLQEAMQQVSARYLAALARGQRLLEDRLRFRRQTAAQVQKYRYKDMAFRIFRNDALQKYRAQFDMAAMYVYLAAKAYDYETNLLDMDRSAGQHFLTNIIRKRTIGVIGDNGQPQTGTGLADSMAMMIGNWDLLKSGLGFNNPQTETNRFSLRKELFRIEGGPNGDKVWLETLQRHFVDNILDLPEFRRYCRPFQPIDPIEPGLVIPFSTNINSRLNFFGWPLGGGDSFYGSSNFTTKIRSVGIWFTGYNNLSGGMSNTPRVYLIPVGSDIMRSPTGDTGTTREWKVIEQKLPLPFRLSEAHDPGSVANLNLDWVPTIDTLSDEFAAIQKYSSFRAYHDSGNFREEETINNNRLVGRSVWNTRWLLIIPAATLHSNREEGLERFIHGALFGGERDGNGVSDIKIFFQTYAYSGG